MPRLPVYFVLDVSGSMAGEPVDAVNRSLVLLIDSLRENPMLRDIVYLSILTFDRYAKVVLPLTGVNDLDEVPVLSVSDPGGICMGRALELVAARAAGDVVDRMPEGKGDYPPLVFLLVSSRATDDVESGLKAFNERKWGNVVACGVGNDVSAELRKITKNVVVLETADRPSIMSFFNWGFDIISTCFDGK